MTPFEISSLVVAIAAAVCTVGGSIIYSAYRIGTKVETVNLSVQSTTAAVNDLKNELRVEVASLQKQLRELDTHHRAEQAQQWEAITRHEQRIDAHGEQLARLDHHEK